MVAMNDYFEVDLPGELTCRCAESHEEPVSWEELDANPDRFACDCTCHEVPDLEGPWRVIPSTGDSEPDTEPPAECALCGEAGAEPQSGVCRICAARLPKVGGCGLAVRLVAGLVAAETGPALHHLAACPDCLAFFDRLGDLARVADMETSYAGSLAAVA
jgi:hypothetical protein